MVLPVIRPIAVLIFLLKNTLGLSYSVYVIIHHGFESFNLNGIVWKLRIALMSPARTKHVCNLIKMNKHFIKTRKISHTILVKMRRENVEIYCDWIIRVNLNALCWMLWKYCTIALDISMCLNDSWCSRFLLSYI